MLLQLIVNNICGLTIYCHIFASLINNDKMSDERNEQIHKLINYSGLSQLLYGSKFSIRKSYQAGTFIRQVNILRKKVGEFLDEIGK